MRTTPYGATVFLRTRSARFSSHYAGYNLSCTGTFLIKMGALLLIERFSGGWDVLICNILALCVSGIANFVLNEHVVFRKKNQS